MKKTKQPEILHLIDLGNTRATYGIVKNGKLSKVESLDCNAIPEKIVFLSKKGLNRKNTVIISSVVPKNTQKIASELYARGAFNVLEIGKEIPVPIKHRYQKTTMLGIDRRINAYGAIQKKKLPCLIFDFGTALTCDLVDEKGCFIGGLIIPGPETSLRSLLDRAALLPKLFTLKKESGKTYGRNTRDCIQHGVIQAYAAMTDGLIAQLSKEFKRKPHVIITGGFSAFIGKIIHKKAEINSAHTLQSMLTIYKSWKATRF